MSGAHVAGFRVTALDAACVQLDRAISLYFDETDPVSCHSLASNAMEIIERTAEAVGVRTLRVRLKEILDRGQFKYAHDTIYKARNFFKHGKSDDEIVFDDDWNLFVLVGAAFTLHAVGKRTNATLAFMIWVSQLDQESLTEINTVFSNKLPSLEGHTRSQQKVIGRDHLARAISDDMATLLD